MVNEEHIYTGTRIGNFVVLFILCMIEASKVEHSASYVVVAGGCWRQSSFRLPAPRISGHSKPGAPFQKSHR